MSKQARSIPIPEENFDEEVVTASPPDDGLDEQPLTVKKKESTLVSGPASTEPGKPSKPSSEKSTSTANKYEAIAIALDAVNPLAKPIYDFGRRIVSGFTDDLPKSVAQGLEVAKSSVAPGSVKDYVKTNAYVDFQKYVRKKEGLKWYQPFDENKYIDKYADVFMQETGRKEEAAKITARAPEVIKRRQEVEKYVQQQKMEAGEKMAGAIQDFRDIKSADDVASYIATMGGQAIYQIPLAVLTKGGSSFLQESAEVYDQQISSIAKEKGISRQQVIERGLDKPAEGQAYAILAASLDAASAVNIMGALKKGAKVGLLKKWLKSAGPEIITEPIQGVLETVGGARGDKIEAAKEAILDPDRVNEALGGLIGGSAGVFGSSPAETVKEETTSVNINNEPELDQKANTIQDKVEANESAVNAGHQDAPVTEPITDDQKTQTAPTEPVKGTVQEGPVSEDIQEEALSPQGEPQVQEQPEQQPVESQPETLQTPEEEPAPKTAKEQIDDLVESGDLQRDAENRVTIKTEKGGTELKRILEENKIKHKPVERQTEQPAAEPQQQQEGEPVRTVRDRDESGGVKGVPPYNQFKFNQGNDFYPVRVVLTDEQSDMYQTGKKTSKPASISHEDFAAARDFVEKVKQHARENRDKNREVILDFRPKKNEPVSIKSATEVDVRQQTGDGGTLAKGDTGQQEIAKASINEEEVKGQKVTGFKTVKGSTYTVEGSKTTRTKAARAEHPGDSGLKEQSEETVYIDPKYQGQADQIYLQGGTVDIHKEGNEIVLDLTADNGKKRQVRFPYQANPAVGLMPFEMWGGGKNAHLGTPITEIQETKPEEVAPTTTPKDVHTAAKTKGIDFESPEFMAASKNITGKEHLDDMTPGELDQMIDYVNQPKPEKISGPIDQGPTGTPPPPVEGLTKEESKRESELRKTWLGIKDNPDIPDEVKAGISKEGKEYVPRSLTGVTKKEADAIVDAMIAVNDGNTDAVVKMFLDDNSGVSADVETAIGAALFEKLQKAENYADAVRVFEKLAIRGTELGQAVNAYKLLRGKTMAYMVDKAIQKTRKTFKAKNEWRGQDMKKAVDKSNKDAVEKVLKSPKVKKKIQSEVQKGGIKKAIDFLEKLKIDTKGKALDITYGITAEAWNTVITAVQKGLQAGLTIAQAINKAVGKVKDPAFQKKEAAAFLDENLKEYRVTLDPGRAIKEELKSSGQKLDDIVRQHYSQQVSTRESLVEKLIKDGNIPEDQAQAIADELRLEFARLTADAKTKALKKLLPKVDKKVTPTQKKETLDKLIEQSNMGALSSEQYNEVIAKELGVPSLDAIQLKEIEALTNKIHEAKGDTQKSKASQDLMNYIEGIKGWDWLDATGAIWYANVLSGPSTWLVTNPFANLTNFLAEMALDIKRNPTKSAFILSNAASGLMRGITQAADVMGSGYNPHKGEDFKTEAHPLLERVKFIGGPFNPINWLKYVSRAMKAGDVIFYQGLKQQKLAVIALREARKNGRTEANKADNMAVYDKLLKGNFDNAMEQAASEGFKGREQKIRAYEILEESLPEYAVKEAENFAARGTFNIKPEGTLGGLASGLNKMRQELPALKAFVPFVNTIINVANEYMNYNPIIGGIRAVRGATGGWTERSRGTTRYRKFSQEERFKVGVKASIGLMAMVAIGLLDDPDDEDGYFEITANGTGDLQKNYQLEKDGWRPYSLRIGDTWWSYKNLPIAMPLASVGYWKDSQRYRKDPKISEGLQVMASGTIGFMMDLSALTGLTDLAKMLTTETLSEQSTNIEKMTKTIEKIGKSVVIPNYFTQLSRVVQELTESPIKRANEIGQSVIRDVPVLRDHLGNLYDAFGDPVIPKQLEKLIPLNAHRSPTDKAMVEFLNENNLWVGVPAKTNLKPNGEPMTEEEFQKFALESAREIKKRLLMEYKIFSRVKNKEEVKDWFEDIKREERSNAKRTVFGYF